MRNLPANIEQFDRALATTPAEDTMADILARATANLEQQPFELPQIPEAVSRFCDQIDKNFSTTVEQLEATAQAMHLAANELESRAKELKAAGPDVSEEVKKWIVYERESREKQKFYSSLFK